MASGCCSSEDPLDGPLLRTHPGVPRLSPHIHEPYAFLRSRRQVHISAFCIPPPASPSSSLSQTDCPAPLGRYHGHGTLGGNPLNPPPAFLSAFYCAASLEGYPPVLLPRPLPTDIPPR